MQSIRLGFVLFASVVLGATNPLIVVRQALFTNFVWLMGKSGRGFCMDCIDRCPDPNAKSILPEDSVIRQAVTVALSILPSNFNEDECPNYCSATLQAYLVYEMNTYADYILKDMPRYTKAGKASRKVLPDVKEALKQKIKDAGCKIVKVPVPRPDGPLRSPTGGLTISGEYIDRAWPRHPALIAYGNEVPTRGTGGGVVGRGQCMSKFTMAVGGMLEPQDKPWINNKLCEPNYKRAPPPPQIFTTGQRDDFKPVIGRSKGNNKDNDNNMDDSSPPGGTRTGEQHAQVRPVAVNGNAERVPAANKFVPGSGRTRNLVQIPRTQLDLGWAQDLPRAFGAAVLGGFERVRQGAGAGAGVGGLF